MARPPAKELTERELEVMHVFWNRGESTVAEVRDVLAESGLDRAYTTVATLGAHPGRQEISGPDERGAAIFLSSCAVA